MEEAEPKLQSTRLTRSQKRKYEQSKSDVSAPDQKRLSTAPSPVKLSPRTKTPRMSPHKGTPKTSRHKSSSLVKRSARTRTRGSTHGAESSSIPSPHTTTARSPTKTSSTMGRTASPLKSLRIPELTCSPSVPNSMYFGDPLPDSLASVSPLLKTLPGRSGQVQHLRNLLISDPRGACPPCLYLYGPKSTGKSLTITTVLSHLKLPNAVVHSRECYSREIFFTDVINQLTGVVPTKCNNYFGRGRCDNLSLFVDRLSRILAEGHLTSSTNASCAIVVEEVEGLYSRDPVLVQGLVTVPQLVGRGLVLVLTSHQSADLLLESGALVLGLVEPIFFPPYSKDEVLEILMLDCPANVGRPAYQTFLHYMWNVLQVMCNDLGELKHLNGLLFSRYVEPVERGEVDIGETRKLWRRVEPFIRKVLNGTSLHDTSTSQPGPGTIPDLPGRVPDLPTRVPDLPLSSKYLLLASFLASNNPASTDKQFFSNLKKAKHRKSKKCKVQQLSRLISGPGVFTVDRVLAILHCIMDSPVLSEGQLLCQLSTLVSVHYLAHVNKEESLGCPRYRCRLSLDDALHIASTVGFDLLHHLHQPDR